jgi:uncharacterized Zn finger protein
LSFFEYRPYVSVAQRKAQALRKMQKLAKKGLKIQPIEARRKIVSTFWGKAWCDHIEAFGDYVNRLPRGKRYVRNGSVCHLSVEKGNVEAKVAGSDTYNVSIKIKPLSSARWSVLKKQCSGKIGTLLELLSGELSDEVMSAVCNHSTGLFPSAKEINYSCDCPDWAEMCKHIAAVLYGVGSRLDSDPQSLFSLRGVNYKELIDVGKAVTSATKTTSKRRRIASDELSEVFDVDMSVSKKNAKTVKAKSTKKPRAETKKRAKKSTATKKVKKETATTKKESPNKKVGVTKAKGTAAKKVKKVVKEKHPKKKPVRKSAEKGKK